MLAYSLTSLPGVGPSTAGKLQKLGLNSVFDLLYHLPFRYEDRRLISPISQAHVGLESVFSGTISAVKNTYTKSGRLFQTATLTDATGSLLISWFNQPFLSRTLHSGIQVNMWGKIDSWGNKLALISPDYEIITSKTTLHTGRLVPIYPETLGVTSKWLRVKIFSLLNSPLPIELLPNSQQFNLLNWRQALYQAHFPNQPEQVEPARSRLALDELVLTQLTSLLRRQHWQQTKLTHPFSVNQDQITAFIANLPFTLTPSQNRALREILSDLSRATPMNRLLEGDVGSGKTVVAAAAALVVHSHGYQTLFLAPTQILAQQHFVTLTTLLKPLGITLELITSASTKSVNLAASVIVGTHALLNTGREYPRVGLVVIDEQHRFGVIQRGLVAAKGQTPHILTMTATPIPRTVALSLYGDLDLSVLDTPPSGRLPIKTWVVPEAKRASAYTWIKDQLTTSKSQAFIVCPFITDSETLQSVKSAVTEFTRLQEIFPQFRLGLLHGRLKASEKQQVLDNFRGHQLDILVTTPVVEVGIDIPTATIMLIEDAERFGLSQLHQLRGRVGRGSLQSYCLLFSAKESTRLKALENHFSGMELAEIDFRLRGPGDILGTSQHGLLQFRTVRYQDFSQMEKAKTIAASILPQLAQSPELKSLINKIDISLILPN